MNHVLIFSYPSFPTSHTCKTSTDKGIVCGWVLVSLVGYVMNVNNVFNVFNVQIMADNHSSMIMAHLSEQLLNAAMVYTPVVSTGGWKPCQNWRLG
jgi:hypothetical protein